MRLHGLGHLAVEVVPHEPYELGPFVVRFVPSRHSKLLFGRKVPMDGELTCDHLHGLVPTAYRCGQVWGIRIDVAGVTLYHQGSADLDDRELRAVRLPRVVELLEQYRPDVLCMQETKCEPDAFPDAELAAAGYHAVHHSAGRWAGVAIAIPSDVPFGETCRGLAASPPPKRRAGS